MSKQPNVDTQYIKTYPVYFQPVYFPSMASSSSSSKRRKLDTTPPTKGWISNLHFETFCIKRVISTKGPGQSAGSAAIGQSAGSAVIGQIDASIPIISDVTEGQSAECGPRNFPPAKDCLPDYEVWHSCFQYNILHILISKE